MLARTFLSQRTQCTRWFEAARREMTQTTHL